MTAKPYRRKTLRHRKWSASVMRHSDALDLEKGVFMKSPRAMALSLKRSAERSRRRKSGPYHSAMSMLTFYINRGRKQLFGRAAERAREGEDRIA